MFDGLMRGSVFPKPNTIMSHGINYRLVHQCRQSYGRTCIVCEYKEGSRIGAQSPVKLNASRCCTHSQFPDPPCYISTFWMILLKVGTFFKQRLGRGLQVRTSPYQPGQSVCYCIEE